MRWLQVLLLSFLIPAIVFADHGGEHPITDFDAAELVIRDLLYQGGSGLLTNVEAFAISFPFQHLSKDFLNRFRDYPTPVRGEDACEWSHARVLDKSSGLPAILLVVQDMQEVGSNRVSLSGGYIEDGGGDLPIPDIT